MKTDYVLELAEQNADLARVGGKGASLTRLANAGLPVPDGFHITTSAYEAFVEANDLASHLATTLRTTDRSDPDALEAVSREIRDAFEAGEIPAAAASVIVDAYSELAGRDGAVAVRSSANVEDLPSASFAGQQETYLNVSGPSAILEAVRKCWGSLWTVRAIAYREKQGIDHLDVRMAVAVQTLVPADAAGVLFTANPMNGSRDEMVINAAWGLGEAVVAGLVSPDSIVAAKGTGNVILRQTVDKQVMTVRLDAGTEERPVPKNLRRVPVLDDESVGRLVRLGRQIETLYGRPMDVEWALQDGKVTILQARPITTLLESPSSSTPDWKLPQGAYIAMRNNIVELLADPLSPLFATLGLSSVNQALGELMGEFLGRRDVLPQEVIITVNGYAYYNGSIRPGRMLLILFDSVGIARRMFTKPVQRWVVEGRPAYLETIQHWQGQAWRDRTNRNLLMGIGVLSKAAIRAYGSLVSGIIPAAWISEAIFTMVYRMFIKRRGDPAAPVFLLGYDSTPILAEKSIFDLAQWIREQPELAQHFDRTSAETLAEQLRCSERPASVPHQIWEEGERRFEDHLHRFGHTIYNLDFASPVPADDPIPTLQVLKMFVKGRGVDPHARQQESIERRRRAQAEIEARLGRIRLGIFRTTLARAQRFAPMREDGIADVGLAYPLLRRMLMELGRRLVVAGAIRQADDIFWLEEREVVDAAARLDAGHATPDLSGAVAARRRSQQEADRLSPPFVLPHRILGIAIGRRRAARGTGEILEGVAASPGCVEAPASVLTGPRDFSKMKDGDVLVAAITTPAWTPLFARASALVTDVGGPLSHGSIVAREYGIPAVLGTGAATSRVRSGQKIAVDGNAGKVYLWANGAAPNGEENARGGSTVENQGGSIRRG